MPTKTDPRESFHGEEEETPLFGPGSGRDDTPAGDPSDPTLYDSHKTPLMDSSDPREPKSLSPRDLADAESAGGIGNTGKTDDREAAAGKIPFNQADKLLPLQARIAGKLAGLFKSNKGRAGIATTGIVSGAIFLAFIGQGPFELIHLGQVLLKPEANSEQTSSGRFLAMLRYAKTGDFGETRVGFLRSKLKDKYISDLNKAGIDFEKTSLGRPSIMTIDTKNPAFSKYKDLGKKEFLSKVGLPAEYTDEVKATRNGSKWSLEFDVTKPNGISFADKATLAVSKEVGLGNIANGKLGTNLRFRTILRPYFGLPGLLSPISKKNASSLEKASNYIDSINAEKDRASPRREKIKELTASVRGKLRDKLSGKTGLFTSAVLAGGGAACLVHDAADDAAEYNYQGIVKASAIEATDKGAVGSQGQAGVNTDSGPLSAKALGTIQRTLTDSNGKSVWASKELDALAKNGKGAKGEELPNEYQQAFSSSTTADNIKKSTEVKAAGVDVTSITCGWPGAIAGGGITLALLAAGPATGGASWVAFVAKTGASAAAGAGVSILIANQIEKFLSEDQIVDPPLNGPLGGGLLARGARASAGMNAIASGGVQLSDSETHAFLEEQQELEDLEFREKSFFARMFDLHDYRSLASATMRGHSSNIIYNTSSISSKLLDGPVSLFSVFWPKAYAQEETYDWGGQPMYGIPKEVREDKRLQDPYENDLEMALLLDSSKGNSYIDKAKKCFGVEISKGDAGWGVKTVEEVKTVSSEYTKANCSNVDDINWRRTMLFVLDSKDASALACYEGLDDEACAETGYGGNTEASSSSSVSGDTAELAQQILDEDNVQKVGRYVSEDLNNTADSKPAYENVKLDVNLLKFILDVGKESDKPLQITSITGDGCGHSDNTCKSAGGSSMHYEGKAVDIGCNGISGSLLDRIGKKYGVKSNYERCDAGIDHYHFSTTGS
ncbi:hypothetical protein HZB74_03520 [Candidatus Saccharibacteria bacterium]|nr:hypothetical protein [Candidatus Saccharibacteria bacterium]